MDLMGEYHRSSIQLKSHGTPQMMILTIHRSGKRNRPSHQQLAIKLRGFTSIYQTLQVSGSLKSTCDGDLFERSHIFWVE